MAVKTFTDGVSLPASDINTFLANSGLVYVGSQTVTAGVSSVVVSGFNSTYDSYRLVWNNGTMAGLAVIAGTMTGSAASYYGALTCTALPTNTFLGVSNNNASNWSHLGVGNSTWLNCSFDIHNPFLARPTHVGPASYTSTTDSGTYNGMHFVSTSYSSITLTCVGSTFSGGTITLYGYRKA